MRRPSRGCDASPPHRLNEVIEIREFGFPPPESREASVSGPVSKWSVAEETPVSFVFNGRSYAVMMATPADLADFAVGFTHSERVVSQLGEIHAIEIHYGEIGIDLRLELSRRAIERLDARTARRNLVGRAGCGVCGVDGADVFFEKLPEVASSPLRIAAPAILKAVGELPLRQPLNALTKSVHAAAWAELDGSIRLVREDVGRHNALDKLLGACLRRMTAIDDGFVVVSSRCSFEIVEKAARCGVRAVVSISAPTAFAIRKAEEAKIALYALAGEGVVAIVF